MKITVLSRKASLGCLRNKRGQTLVEYALILSFISVVAISTLLAMGGQVSGVYTTINRQMNDAQNGGATASSRTH